jgi:predicted nucleic acid-binding protein
MLKIIIRIRNCVFGKRKVTLDTNVILSDVAFGSDAAKEAVEKSTSDDQMMFTSIIYDECMKFTGSKNNKKGLTKDEMDKELKDRFGEPEKVDIPSKEELHKKFRIRDEDDYKILHSAEHTRSKIIVTKDNDFLDPKTKGPKWAKIMNVNQYIGKSKFKKKK